MTGGVSVSKASVRYPRSARASVFVAELRDHFAQGRPVSARAYLEDHPELQLDRDAVLDLAYEEYVQRLELGERVEVEEFLSRISWFRDELAELIHMHHDVEAKLAWPEPGQEFAGYKVIRELGRGTFARVFYATESAIGDRPVVIKVSDQAAAEANILGQLSHPNIVPIHSIQQDARTGKSIVCMPYLGKATLVDHMRQAFAAREMPRSARVIDETLKPADWEPARPGPLAGAKDQSYVEGVLGLGVQLADALAFVHARGIFHRDLKPSNVLLACDGRPMLLDFNLSVEQNQHKGDIGGTVEYMSPELLRMVDPSYAGRPFVLDGRTDIFSLGVILYELLSGVHPFGPLPRGGTKQTIPYLLQRHPHGPASLQVANPDVPRALADVVEKCLAPDADHRFRTAGEFAAALRNCQTKLASTNGWVIRHRRRIRRAVAVASVFLVILIAVVLSRESRATVNQREGIKALREHRYMQAIDSFSEVLSRDGSAASAYFGRGWAYLGAGEYRRALEDFEKADKLAGNGRTKASIAEALVRLNIRGSAAAHYEQAISAGFETAPLLNNLAYCYLSSAETRSKAEDCLQRALLRDPTLQPALCNRLMVELQRTLSNPRRAATAIVTTKELVAAAAPNGHLYYDAACIFAIAAKSDAKAITEGLNYAAKAIEHGFDPKRIVNDPLLRELRKDRGFDTVLQTPPGQPATRPSQLAPLGIQLD